MWAGRPSSGPISSSRPPRPRWSSKEPRQHARNNRQWGGLHSRALPRSPSDHSTEPKERTTMNEWQPIETAPRNGKTIFAEHWQTGQRGMVHFNSQGEWELVSMNNTPMGIGFYPTHWVPLLAPPARSHSFADEEPRTGAGSLD